MADIFDYIKELTRLELSFIDENGRPNTLKSYIKSLDDGRILIDPPNDGIKTYNISDNKQILMIVYAEEGVYCGESKVLSKEISTTPGLWVSYPYNSQHYQRREYLRAPIHLKADITLIKDREGNNKEKFSIITRDISGKGFSYISDKPLDEYYDIEVEIYLWGKGHPSIKSRCEHIYSKNSSNDYVNALALVDINPRDIESIVKECFKHTLEQKTL